MAKFTLQDGTEIEAFTPDEVKATIEKETGGLKAKVDELLGEKKTVAQRARELEEAQAKAEEERQREKGEFKTLYEREQKARQDLAAQLEETRSAAQRKDISLESAKVAGLLSRDAGRAELLAEKVAQMAKHSEKGVTFEIGGVEVDQAKLVAHLQEKYPFLIDANGMTGGGAPVGTHGGRAAPKGDMGGNRAERQAAIAARFKLPQ